MPRVAVIAGPNGSGKSSFYERVLAVEFPVFINADHIAAALPDDTPRGDRNLRAANVAEARRLRAVQNREDFAFETVFSRTDHWLSFLTALRSSGFEIWLFFICTSHPLLNVKRIETRVLHGGHGVPAPKVISGFDRSIRTVVAAKPVVNQLWLYDNTETGLNHKLVARFLHGEADFVAATIPPWATPFFF